MSPLQDYHQNVPGGAPPDVAGLDTALGAVGRNSEPLGNRVSYAAAAASFGTLQLVHRVTSHAPPAAPASHPQQDHAAAAHTPAPFECSMCKFKATDQIAALQHLMVRSALFCPSTDRLPD